MLEEQEVFGEGLSVRGVRAASNFAQQSSLPLRFIPVRRGVSVTAGGEHCTLGDVKMTYMWSKGDYQGRSHCVEASAEMGDDLLISLCLAGGCEIKVNGTIIIKPGDLVILPASGPMTMTPLSKLATLSFHVAAQRLWQTAGANVISALYCRPLRGPEGIADIIGSTMIASWRARKLLDSASACGLIEGLGALLKTGAQDQHRSLLSLTQSRQSFLWALRQQLKTLLDDGELVDPALLAKELNCSVRTMQAALRDAGTTLGKLVMEERLARAAALLSSPLTRQRNISEIAFASGFADISYFNRCFKRRFRLSPSEYRNTAAMIE